jgi:glycosyltransferase involved in cell wall biosynthesis
MRILFVNHLCGYFGGVEQYIADVARGLTEKGNEVFLAYGNQTDRNPQQYSELFHSVFRVKEMAKPGPENTNDFAEVVRKVAPDIIFAHKLEKIDFLLKYRDRLPVFVMIHDHSLCCPRQHKYFFWNRRICNLPFGWHCFLDLAFLERNPKSRFKFSLKNIFSAFSEMKKYRQLQNLIVGSRAMHEELLKNGFKHEQIIIQPPVVNLPVRDYSPPPDRPEILFVGQLIKGKGVDLLIEALSLVKRDFHLKIVGDGNAAPELRDMVEKKGLADKIELCGWIDRDKLAEFYRNCLFTVVPSRWPEPFGMVGLEAMSFGRACIAFRVGGIPDWLEDGVTGYLIEPQDCLQMTEKINFLLENPETVKNLGQNGRESFLKKFDFLQSIQRLEKLFSDRIERANKQKED